MMKIYPYIPYMALDGSLATTTETMTVTVTASYPNSVGAASVIVNSPLTLFPAINQSTVGPKSDKKEKLPPQSSVDLESYLSIKGPITRFQPVDSSDLTILAEQPVQGHQDRLRQSNHGLQPGLRLSGGHPHLGE